MAAQNGEGQKKLRILMLHGYTQSGPLFHAKTKALEKALDKIFPAEPKPGYLKQYPGGVQLTYPTAPIRLDYRDIPGFDVDGDKESPEAYGWWIRKGDSEPFRYDGMEKGLTRIAEVLRDQGPFDGVIGFSQGGAAAGMVAALLEPNREKAFQDAQSQGGMPFPELFIEDSGFIVEPVHQPLKFAVSYSGFGAITNPLYRAFYEPKIKTPMCHFIGTVDTVVEESRSLRLVDACVDGRGKPGGVSRLVYHPGGHFLPSSHKQYVAALAAFIREAIGETEGVANGKKDENAEDMVLPF
ncbi:hypothetical protein K431DRAFT_285959 [Polychaeton citri CBS 116435]|uniref:Serine hydrolase domain-containing protein n=1 Tax=Polychaeton citri CBS 116435 TaxID=1314669 RepID=A0A9P4ULM2_9PEZI|nr:hypothetical protein K431DRAFT_285959 [Polychaeton citri CBS 116435]